MDVLATATLAVLVLGPLGVLVRSIVASGIHRHHAPVALGGEQAIRERLYGPPPHPQVVASTRRARAGRR